MTFLKHLIQNSRITLGLAGFALVIAFGFVLYASVTDGWEPSYFYVLLVPVVLLSIALVYDYVKFKSLKK